MREHSQPSPILEHNKGFTLIELLIAASIIGVIGASLTSMLWSGLKVWRMEKAFVRTYQNTRFSEERLRKDLANMVYHSRFKFEGNTSEVSFLTRETEYNPESQYSGLKEIRYYMDDTSPGKSLKRLSRTLGSSSELYGELMLQNIQDFQLQYAKVDEDKIDWVLSWDDNNALPPMIKIAMTLKNPRGQSETHQTTIPIYSDHAY